MSKARDIASANPAPTTVSTTELGYLDGVTSAIQTQLNQKSEYAAGKNKIINGDFGVWQRGTSFTTSNYCADRWVANFGSVTSPSYSRSTFSPGTAPVSDYEGTYFMTMSGTLSDAVNGYFQLDQRIEDVRTFAGQTVTLSFWAKGSATGTISANISQIFGSGGSANVVVNATNFNITTSWARYTTTLTYPSIAGKTIGTGSYARISISKLQGTAVGNQTTWGAATFTGTLDIWGVQLEAGSTVSPFQTATGTIQGELAACQRYYFRTSGTDVYKPLSNFSYVNSTTTIATVFSLPVQMRTSPTSIEYAGTIQWLQSGGGAATPSSFTLSTSSTTMVNFNGNSTGLTVSQFGVYRANNDATAYFGFSAEL